MKAALLAISLLLVPCSADKPPVESRTPKLRTYRAEWLSCYDGDTCDFVLHLGLGVRIRQTIRFYGIDTPELRGSSRVAGLAARDFVIQILGSGPEISLQVPQRRNCTRLDDCDERCRYGRLLANVITNGQNLNNLLLQSGHAEVY